MYPGSIWHYRVCGSWRRIPTNIKICSLLLFLSFAVLLVAAVWLATVHVAETKLIVANQTVSYQQSGYNYLCDVISIAQYIIDYSDNKKGLNVSAFLVDQEKVKTENVMIPSSTYDGTNIPIDSGTGEDEVHYLVPYNYYSYPVYLLKGSTITLECEMHGKEDGSILEYALVHIFDSRDSAVDFQLGKGKLKQKIYTINVTDCVHNVCIYYYTVDKNSFYFPVLASKADFNFYITTNFSFQAIHYVNPFSYLQTSDIALISINESQQIAFQKSKLMLLYVHPPAFFYETKLSHLNFTCLPATYVIVPIVIGSTVPFVISLLFSVAFCLAKLCRKRKVVYGIKAPLLSEKTPLIQKF